MTPTAIIAVIVVTVIIGVFGWANGFAPTTPLTSTVPKTRCAEEAAVVAEAVVAEAAVAEVEAVVVETVVAEAEAVVAVVAAVAIVAAVAVVAAVRAVSLEVDSAGSSVAVEHPAVLGSALTSEAAGRLVVASEVESEDPQGDLSVEVDATGMPCTNRKFAVPHGGTTSSGRPWYYWWYWNPIYANSLVDRHPDYCEWCDLCDNLDPDGALDMCANCEKNCPLRPVAEVRTVSNTRVH